MKKKTDDDCHRVVHLPVGTSAARFRFRGSCGRRGSSSKRKTVAHSGNTPVPATRRPARLPVAPLREPDRTNSCGRFVLRGLAPVRGPAAHPSQARFLEAAVPQARSSSPPGRSRWLWERNSWAPGRGRSRLAMGNTTISIRSSGRRRPSRPEPWFQSRRALSRASTWSRSFKRSDDDAHALHHRRRRTVEVPQEDVRVLFGGFCQPATGSCRRYRRINLRTSGEP